MQPSCCVAGAALPPRRMCRTQLAIPDKWAVLHVFFESQEEARFVALGFGSRAHVVEPPTLRDEVLQEMTAAVARPPISVLRNQKPPSLL